MKRRKWKKSEVIIAILLDLLGVVAIVALSSILLEYMGGSTVYNDLEKYVILPDEQADLPVEGESVDYAQAGQDEKSTGRRDPRLYIMGGVPK